MNNNKNKKMKNAWLIIPLIIATVIGQWSIVIAQTLAPKVTPASGGYSTSGGTTLTWTIGETYNTTLSTVNIQLSEGEQQPEIDLLTGTVSSTLVCSGSTVNVPFTAFGYVDAGNVFTAQLSNASGSFASPVNIGTLTTVLTGTIAATLPALTSPGTGYRIRVVSSKPVYTGRSNTHNIIINSGSAPSRPGAISVTGGNAKVCPGESCTYTVPVVAGVAYNWTPPAGGVITNGQGTSSVTISYDNTFNASGVLSVVKVNGCGNSVARTASIVRNNPAAPSVITGDVRGVCARNAVPYTVIPVAAITYNWAAPAGAIITNGQGTNAIVVDFTASVSVGNVTVSASNACGTSAVRRKEVRTTPATPQTIIGASKVCANQFGVPYSTIPVPYTTSYTWSAPPGAHINDGVTTSAGRILTTTSANITVNYASASGTVQVQSNSACGSSSKNSVTVLFNCRDANEIMSENSLFAIYPDPTNDIVNIKGEQLENSRYSVTLTNTYGQLLIKKGITTATNTFQTQFHLEDLPPGMYFVTISSTVLTRAFKVQKL